MSSFLADFVLIGPQTSLYTPPNPIKGQLIVLCTWLGAARKNIRKYISLHQRIAPGVRVLLIESTIPMLMSTYARQRSAINPAVSVILDVLAECRECSLPCEKAHPNSHMANAGPNIFIQQNTSSTASSPRIIIHVFSNGGGNTATQLLLTLRSRLGSPLPLTGLILDSGPSNGTYGKSYDAILLSLPPSLLSRLLGPTFVHLFLIALFTWIACGNENPATLGWCTLLDSDVIRGIGEAGERKVCLIYSKADRMCEWKDVRAHAEKSRRKGWGVREVVFEDSEHCAHFLRDAVRYTEAVEGMWEGGNEIKGLHV